MRVALVSDIHGSLVALEAVVTDIKRRGVEQVFHGGDVALMGPQPAEVIERLRQLGWRGVLGNTDELLWNEQAREQQLARAPKLRPIIELLFDSYRPHTLDQLPADQLAWLQQLPRELTVGQLRLVHAAPGDLWRAPLPDADDETLAATYAANGVRAAAYGHIHWPFARRVGEQLVVANCGSVSLPWDGDPRASYLLVEDGQPEVVRVPYDVEQDCALLLESKHPDAERLAQMKRSGRFVAPLR